MMLLPVQAGVVGFQKSSFLLRFSLTWPQKYEQYHGDLDFSTTDYEQVLLDPVPSLGHLFFIWNPRLAL
jgi:hypothetical protein